MTIKSIIFSIFLFPFWLSSQNGLHATFSRHSIGINKLFGDSIYAQDVSFSYVLNDFKLDTHSQLLLLKFSEPEQEYLDQANLAIYSLFDYSKKELLWNNGFKNSKTYFNLIDDKVFLNTKDGSGLWDIKTRQFVWKVNSPLFINKDLYDKRIGIATNLKGDGQHFAGIDLANGEVKWKYPDFKVLGDVFHMPLILDSILFFINEGITTVNLNSGIVRSNNYLFNVVARDNQSGTTAAILGGLVGYLIYEIVDNTTTRGNVKTPNHFASHHSNFLYDSFVYVSSAEYLHKFSKKGYEIANKIHYKERNAGISEMFYLGGKKCLLNFGYNYVGGSISTSSCSYVFIERFDDSLNLTQGIDFKELKNKYTDELQGKVIDYRVFNDSLHLFFENAYLVLDTSLNIVGTKPIHFDDKWLRRMDKNFCYKQDSIFACIDLNTAQDYFIENRNGSISWYTVNGDKVKTIPKKNIFYEIYADSKVKIIGDQSDDYILDNGNKLILELPKIEKVLKNGRDYVLGFKSGFLIVEEGQLFK